MTTGEPEPRERPVLDGRRGTVGRPVAVLATVAGALYLAWRVTATRTDAAPWLFWPALLVEVALWFRFVLGAWSFWRVRPAGTPNPATGSARSTAPQVDVLITTLNDPVSWLRRTLVACASLRHVGTVWVLDDGRRPEVAELAAAFGARHHARSEPLDARAGNVNLGLVLAGTPHVLLLQPGDVPMPDAIDHLAPLLDGDPSAAVALGAHRSWIRTAVGAEDGTGDDELELRVRRACHDGRGALAWEPGPALVRREALLEVDGLQPGTLAPDLHAGIRLQQLGWRIRSCPVTLFEVAGPVNLAATLIARERSSSGRLGVLATRSNPFLTRNLPWRARLAHLEDVAVILGAPILPVVALLVAGVLVTGRSAVDADPAALVLAAAPWALLAAVTRRLLTRGRSGVGDGWRRAVRRSGPDLAAVTRALTGRVGRPRYLPRTGLDSGGAEAVLRMTVPSVSLLVMMGAAIVRMTDSAFDLGILPSLPGAAALPAIAVGALAGATIAQVLGFVARHRQLRADVRLPQAVDASIDGHPALAVDLTPAGAGLRTTATVEPGDTARVTLAIPDVAGVLHRIALPAEVRNDVEGPDGRVVGVRFLPGPADAEDLLLAYCAVVHPYREVRGSGALPVDPRIGPSRAGDESDRPAAGSASGLIAASEA
ncbi:MAG: PilZ domain-containing protein [Acidimicrobiales bacterium]|jgi:cellulose synthase (UDP-forming)|nr:PilZ domain-containing protein [Acidimicrobiales bacterium]